MTARDSKPANDRADTEDLVEKAGAGGRSGGGESGGGAYKDPDLVKGDPSRRSHGGQSEIAYHGPGDAEDGNDNPNAVADSD